MNRPFIKFLTKDLIAEVERSISEPERLQAILEEMKLRKKAAHKLGPVIENIELILNQQSTAVTQSLKSPKNEQLLTLLKEDNRPQKGNIDSSKDTSHPKADESYCFRPGILPSLIGAIDCETIVAREKLTIQSPTLNETITVSDINSIEIKEGLFLADLHVKVSEETIRVIKLSKKQAKIIKVWMTLISKRPEIIKGIKTFQALFERDAYLNHRAVNKWKMSLGNLPEWLNHQQKMPGTMDTCSTELNSILQTLDITVATFNNNLVKNEAKKWREYFSKLESKPLTPSQVEAVLGDEDATLVVAGAGTGKTSTVVGKIGYLLEKKVCNPNEILALAYGRDAAAEMRERVKNKTGYDVEIRTFHSLGLHILREKEGFPLKISDIAVNEKVLMALLANIFKDMTDDERARGLIQNFISLHRYPAKYLEDFDSETDYLKYLRKYEPVTLRGELVKSFEELLIADWLTLHGIRYSYEHPYEYQTSTTKKRQYRPDFYLTDYEIYLEHFGIDKNGNTAPGIDKEQYNEGISWKRNIHAQFGTKLVESYSWERKEGRILELLKEKLEKLGVSCQPAGKELICELLDTREINKKLVSLTKDFLSVFKEGQWTIEEVKAKVDKLEASEKLRAHSFIDLFEEVFSRHESYLFKRQEIDFADLIKKSTELINGRKVNLSFKRIVVDEYQDISRGRYRFLKALIQQSEDCRVMCVGDDWQSIYGFTGSDVSMTTNFESLFGFSARVDLDQTFRFTQPILDTSAIFIQQNPLQLRKKINARPAILEQSIEVLTNSPLEPEIVMKNILSSIDGKRPPDEKWSVLILGRYNFLKPDDLDTIASSFINLTVEFMTVHKSKGLEADAVVVLGLKNERYGFPGAIETDPLMALIIPGEDEYQNAEERRVLYVAMTRAKEYLLLCTDSLSPSSFIEELSDKSFYPEVSSIALNVEALKLYTCPECNFGKLFLKYPNRKQGYGWVCNQSPYCEFKAKTCQKCSQFPIIETKVCANPHCKM